MSSQEAQQVPPTTTLPNREPAILPQKEALRPSTGPSLRQPSRIVPIRPLSTSLKAPLGYGNVKPSDKNNKLRSFSQKLRSLSASERMQKEDSSRTLASHRERSSGSRMSQPPTPPPSPTDPYRKPITNPSSPPWLSEQSQPASAPQDSNTVSNTPILRRNRSPSLHRRLNADVASVKHSGPISDIVTVKPHDDDRPSYPQGGVLSGLTNALGHIINDDDSESRHSDMDNLVKYNPDGYVERYARLVTIFLHRNRWWLRYGLYIAVASFGVLVLAPAALAIFI